MAITLYLNAGCSKSQAVQKLLDARGTAYRIRWYLSEPLDRQELQALLDKLDISAFDLIRHDEQLFKERYEGSVLDESGWQQVLLDNPGLMQRPVIDNGYKAIIARPPEKALEII